MNQKRTRDQIQQEIVQVILDNNFRGLLEVTQRTGKTKVIIDSLVGITRKVLGYKILWVTNEAHLRDVVLPAEFQKWKAEYLLHNVDFLHWRSLGKHQEEYDFIILDEIQHITEKAYEYFKRITNSPNIIGMTGQLPQDIDKKKLIKEGLRLSLLYRYSKDEGVEDEVIADYNIKVMLVPLSTKKDVYVPSRNYYTSEQARYNGLTKLINKATSEGNYKWAMNLRVNRQKFLHGLESKKNLVKSMLADMQNDKLLVFCPTKAITQEVCDYYFHSSGGQKSYDSFQNDEIKHLAVVEKVSTGHTFHNMSGSILMGVDSNQNGGLSQKAARCMVFRKGYTADLYFLVAAGTQEESSWLPKTLKSFNSSKVEIIHYLQNKYLL